jgi:hypothetical protein
MKQGAGTTGKLPTAILICVLWAGATEGWCGRIWDPGPAIAGALEDKWIEVATSTYEDGASTDTLSWHGEDRDEWIDPEGAPPQDEGTEPDVWAGWAPGAGCWWWTSFGEVTEGSFTNLWTAPYEQGGESALALGVADLPQTIGRSERGTRADERRRFSAGE